VSHSVQHTNKLIDLYFSYSIMHLKLMLLMTQIHAKSMPHVDNKH